MRKLYVLFMLVAANILSAQEVALPYREIPDYPDEYTAETVAARMIDGLGFRFYWATEGLRSEDLDYGPNEEVRTTRETIEHIHGLSQFVICSTLKVPYQFVDVTDMEFDQLRKAVLQNLHEASVQLKSGNLSLDSLVIRFENSDHSYPFWNQLNGPIADAIWHCGQIASFRRSSGNPFNSNVSLFNGKLRE